MEQLPPTHTAQRVRTRGTRARCRSALTPTRTKTRLLQAPLPYVRFLSAIGQLPTVVPQSSSEGPQDPEAAAMAAMFKAQTANWEETQEKMSQSVSGSRSLSSVPYRSLSLMHPLIFFFFSCHNFACVDHTQSNVHPVHWYSRRTSGECKPAATSTAAATASAGLRPSPAIELRLLPLRPERSVPSFGAVTLMLMHPP